MTDPYLNEPIDCLSIGKRTLHCLKKAHLLTIRDLLDADEKGSVLAVNGIGPLMYAEIKEALSPYESPRTESQLSVSSLAQANKTGIIESEMLNDQISFLSNELSTVLAWQKEHIYKLITMKLLHPKVMIQGKMLSNLLEDLSIPRFELMTVFSRVIDSVSISEELDVLFLKVSPRNIDILCQRYGPEGKILEEIADVYDITRERVRQIIENEEEKIYQSAIFNIIGNRNETEKIAFIKMQTALYLAEDLGNKFSMHRWEEQVRGSGLLGQLRSGRDIYNDPLDLFLAACAILDSHRIPEVQLPDNIKEAIRLDAVKQPKITLHQLQIKDNIDKEIKKEIRKHFNYSGGINSIWLAEQFTLDDSQIKEIIDALGYSLIDSNWYIPKGLTNFEFLNHSDAFEHGMRKLFQFCGPLEIESICSAAGHIVSKTNYLVPPPTVMEVILEKRGYNNEEGLWYWDGQIDESLNGGEAIIMECIKQFGPVVTHKQIEDGFAIGGLSFALIHATLRRSPLFESLGRGLYKLRGEAISNKDTPLSTGKEG